MERGRLGSQVSESWTTGARCVRWRREAAKLRTISEMARSARATAIKTITFMKAARAPTGSGIWKGCAGGGAALHGEKNYALGERIV